MNISVLITTYNCAQYIHLAVRSILHQTFKDFELLIIDDGSTDNTQEIISRFTDDRVRYIKRNHYGRSDALNYGLKTASYEIVALMDADDIAHPERLEKQIKVITGNENKICYTRVAYFSDADYKIKFLSEEFISQNINRTIALHGFFSNSTMMFHKNHILKYGYDETLPSSEDYSLLLEIKDRSEFILIPEVLLYQRIRKNSLSSRMYNSGNNIIYKIQEPFYRDLTSSFGIENFTEQQELRGWREFFYGSKSLARKYWIETGIHRWDIRIITALILSFLPGSFLNLVKKNRIRFQLTHSFKALFKNDVQKEFNKHYLKFSVNDLKPNILHLQNYINLSCGVSKTIYQITSNTSQKFNHYLGYFGGDGLGRFNFMKNNDLVFNSYKNPLVGLIINSFELYLFCKKNRIQIIHSHHRYFDLLSFILSRFKKVRIVTSVHSRVIGNKFLSYNSDVLIACSNSIKSHLTDYFGKKGEKIIVINNMVDPEEIKIKKTKADILSEFGIPDSDFIIGYIGRIDVKEKGVDILLDAFQILSNEYKNIFLILVGNGSDDNKVRNIIAEKKINAIKINAIEDIYSYYNIMDVVVLPSNLDPFPLVMLECGLMKKAFVGSCVDGIAEFIENKKNGLLFTPGDINGLIRAIKEVYNNREIIRYLAENLNIKVTENNLISNILPKYENIYSSLINAK